MPGTLGKASPKTFDGTVLNDVRDKSHCLPWCRVIAGVNAAHESAVQSDGNLVSVPRHHRTRQKVLDHLPDGLVRVLRCTHPEM